LLAQPAARSMAPPDPGGGRSRVVTRTTVPPNRRFNQKTTSSVLSRRSRRSVGRGKVVKRSVRSTKPSTPKPTRPSSVRSRRRFNRSRPQVMNKLRQRLHPETVPSPPTPLTQPINPRRLSKPTPHPSPPLPDSSEAMHLNHNGRAPWRNNNTSAQRRTTPRVAPTATPEVEDDNITDKRRKRLLRLAQLRRRFKQNDE
jgi:hypothetical protein